jgi:60 kDa SS-A/Ro ribonucleoprotein
MANKTLFQSFMGKLIPAADARNAEHAPAYAFTPKHALGQYAATGCLHATFYASADEQLARVLTLCQDIEPGFIARTAIYSRERGLMKDMPALLCAVLAVRDSALLRRIFPRVIDNARMLRAFVQIVRSGVVGRKSFGTLVKRLIVQWLAARDDASLFKDAVGDQPSLADIIKMVHPRPQTASRAALYGYLLGRPYEAAALPPLVQHYEAYKAGDRMTVPAVPFQMLTSLALGTPEWTAIAQNAAWQMTRMNLNTFARHGVFEQPGLPELIAARLRDARAIARARVLPYQCPGAGTRGAPGRDGDCHQQRTCTAG